MLIRSLAIETGATFVVPIFPGAPNGTAATVVPWIAELLEGLIADAGGSEVTVMGDSAGGAITLSALQLLRDRGAVLPGRAVLISPAIDLRFIDPRIAQIEPRDPALSVPGPRAAAELWRGELAIEDPLVSPLLGDASGLPPLTVFCGSRDICYPDSLTLVAKARAAGVEVEFHNEKGLLHVYPLMPIPEARAAQAVMAPTRDHREVSRSRASIRSPAQCGPQRGALLDQRSAALILGGRVGARGARYGRPRTRRGSGAPAPCEPSYATSASVGTAVPVRSSATDHSEAARSTPRADRGRGWRVTRPTRLNFSPGPS